MIDFYSLDPDIHHFNTLYPDINSDGTCGYYGFGDFNASIVKGRNDLGIFHLNICSLLNKWDELLNFLGVLNVQFDFVCITESWK